MAKIVHYEVYVDKGYGWKLEERFPSDRRNEAFELTKELESGNVAVKIIQEVYDVRTNSYFEVVDYVSGLQKRQNRLKEYSEKKPYRGTFDDARNNETFFINKDMLQAIMKLMFIVVLCLILAEILLILVTPVIETFIAVDRQKTIKFMIFFGIFLILTIPLALKKIPWHVFLSNRQPTSVVNESKVFQKGENLLRRYHLNEEDENPVSPSYPEAPLEYKQYVIEFLSQIISNLDKKSAIRDSFSKLGVKFLIYGGCLELSRYSGLNLAQANSLLNEAFFIIDGNMPDIQAFYEAKKAYSDNRASTYLTGVGSYIMAQTIRERPIDANLLKKAFAQWEALGHVNQDDKKPNEEVDELFYCTLYMYHTIKLQDISDFTNANQVEKLRHYIDKTVDEIAVELNGKKTAETRDIRILNFLSLQDAVLFCMDFFDDFSEYMADVNDENLDITNKFILLPSSANIQKEFVEDIFEHAYDGEILGTEEIKEQNRNRPYNLEFLGKKTLKTTGEKIDLYRVIH